MQLYHLYHHHTISDFAHSDLKLFELSVWLHVLARSLITIFIPILLLEKGLVIHDVIIYYVLYHAFDVPLNFLARYLTRKIGGRWVVVLGTVCFIIYFFILDGIGGGQWSMLFLLALFAALYDVFYWVAHLYLFIKTNSHEVDPGKNTGILYAVKKFAGLLGPAFGALVLIFFSEEILIYVTIAIFMLSLVPLLKMDKLADFPEKPQLSLKEFFSRFTERKNYFSRALFSVHVSAELILWPLFIFILFNTVEAVAYVPILVSITAILFSYFAGKIKEENRDKMIIIGSLFIAAVWIMRIFFDTMLFSYISVFLVGLFSLIVSIPLDSNIFSRGQKTDPLSASTYRNMTSMCMRFLFFALLAILVNIFHVSFLIAALSLLGLVAVNSLFIVLSGKKNPSSHFFPGTS